MTSCAIYAFGCLSLRFSPFEEGCFRLVIFELDNDLSRKIFLVNKVWVHTQCIRLIADIHILDINVVYQVGSNAIKIFAIVFLNANGCPTTILFDKI